MADKDTEPKSMSGETQRVQRLPFVNHMPSPSQSPSLTPSTETRKNHTNAFFLDAFNVGFSTNAAHLDTWESSMSYDEFSYDVCAVIRQCQYSVSAPVIGFKHSKQHTKTVWPKAS